MASRKKAHRQAKQEARVTEDLEENGLGNPTTAESSMETGRTLAENTIENPIKNTTVEQRSVPPESSKDSAPQSSKDNPLSDTVSEQAPSIPPDVALSISHIGYFDPDYPDPSNSKDPIFTTKREFIYRDIFAFLERLRAVSTTMSSAKFTNILRFLPYSFCNSASTWYNKELEDHEREMLLSEDTEIEMWYEALTARFGADGQRLAQSSALPPAETVQRGRRRKPKSERVVFYERRSGEEIEEWQGRIGTRDR